MAAKKKDVIMVKKFVFAEPEFWELLKRMSAKGSMSDAMRKYAKAGMISRSKEFKNIPSIDWQENE